MCIEVKVKALCGLMCSLLLVGTLCNTPVLAAAPTYGMIQVTNMNGTTGTLTFQASGFENGGQVTLLAAAKGQTVLAESTILYMNQLPVVNGNNQVDFNLKSNTGPGLYTMSLGGTGIATTQKIDFETEFTPPNVSYDSETKNQAGGTRTFTYNVDDSSANTSAFLAGIGQLGVDNAGGAAAKQTSLVVAGTNGAQTLLPVDPAKVVVDAEHHAISLTLTNSEYGSVAANLTGIQLESLGFASANLPAPPPFDLGTLPAPVGLSAVAGPQSVALSWNAVSGADHYVIKRGSVTENTYAIIAANVTSVTYVDTITVTGNTYVYAVAGVNAVGIIGEYSDYVHTTLTNVPSEKPVVVLIPNLSQVEVGQTFTVTYGLSNVAAFEEPIYAQDISFTYDPTLLTFVTAAGNGVVSDAVYSTTPGLVRIKLAHISGGIITDGPVFQLVWTAKYSSQTATAIIAAVNVTLAGGEIEAGKEEQAELASTSIQILALDRSPLATTIGQAQSIYDTALTGILPGQYPAIAKATLLTAMQAAQDVYMASNATASQISAAVSSLQQAVQTFQASVIHVIPGDVNRDGKVSIGDLGIVARYYGSNTHSASWPTAQNADVDGNGEVGLTDLITVAVALH
jgi:hypothetical protein